MAAAMNGGDHVQVVDMRAIQKPSKYKDGNMWGDWRFTFENYIACIDDIILEEMGDAAVLTVMIATPTDIEVRKISRFLYAILAGLIEGRGMQMVKTQKESRNGYEVWRTLIAEMEPRSDARALALLFGIMEAKV